MTHFPPDHKVMERYQIACNAILLYWRNGGYGNNISTVRAISIYSRNINLFMNNDIRQELCVNEEMNYGYSLTGNKTDRD